MALKLSAERPDWQQEFRELQMDVRTKSALLLETVGIETVVYLRSLTSKMQPGVKQSGYRPRRAHPGGWADRSGQLVNSYYFAVLCGSRRLTWTEPQPPGPPAAVNVRGSIPRNGLPPGELRLELGNSAEHAVYLERRDGYWILTGVTEESGELIAALRRIGHALGFEIE